MTLIIKVKQAKGIVEKSIGLVGQSRAQNLFIKTRFGIHTFGLRFSIDLVILDKNDRVAVIKEGLKPNRIFFWNPGFDRVIELPAGTVRRKKISFTDAIVLEFI